MIVVGVSEHTMHVLPERDHEPTELKCHEWVMLGRIEYRDKLGRLNNNGTYCWLVVNCKNLDCGAKVLVREDAITDVVEDVLPVDVPDARTDR